MGRSSIDKSWQVLQPGNPSIARAVFVTETLKHWNDNFQVDLQEKEPAPALRAEVQPKHVSTLRQGQ